MEMSRSLFRLLDDSMVGLGRFELPTPCPPDKCANQAALQPVLFAAPSLSGRHVKS